MNTFVPDRDELRVLYDEAIDKLDPLRGNKLRTPFYTQTGDALFEACCLAMTDTASGNKVMRTLSAPPGAGKTSFTYAMLIALATYAERHPEQPIGAVLLSNEVQKANSDFEALYAHIPEHVAVWTKEHDLQGVCNKLQDAPIARFSKQDLRNYAIVVATQQFYLDVNGENARTFVHNGRSVRRVLTFIDEQPPEIQTKEITLAEAEKTLENLLEANAEAKPQLDALLLLMSQYHGSPANQLSRPGIELDYARLKQDLGWFTTNEATKLMKFHTNIPGVDRLFSFAKALVAGTGWIVSDALYPRYVWHETYKILDRSGSAVLLDATSDLDGIADIVRDRVAVEPPRADYSNMTVVLIPQHTTANLRTYFGGITNRQAYAKSMVGTIERHMEPGDEGLVVCKLSLFENRNIPNWHPDDTRHANRKIYAEKFGWDVGGRRLCATHYGSGLGCNDWADASTVFLFDMHIVPRRSSVARTQGYRSHRAHEGDLGRMRSINNKAKGVDLIATGDMLRHLKQLALRGRARNYGPDGSCGKQKLVISCNINQIRPYIPLMFPGAEIITETTSTSKASWSTKVLQILTNTQEDILSTAQISELVGKPWRTFSHCVLKPKFTKAAEGHGWRYLQGKGQTSSRFERMAIANHETSTSTEAPLAASPVAKVRPLGPQELRV
jgi:hypothetical protein